MVSSRKKRSPGSSASHRGGPVCAFWRSCFECLEFRGAEPRCEWLQFHHAKWWDPGGSGAFTIWAPAHEQPLHGKAPLHTEVMAKQLVERYYLSGSVSGETPQTGITSSPKSPFSHKLIFLVDLIISMILFVFTQAVKPICLFTPLHYLPVMSDIWLHWPCWVNLVTTEGKLSRDNDQLKPVKWPVWLLAEPDMKTIMNLHSMASPT